MSRRTNRYRDDLDAIVGELNPVPDFLPPPEVLARAPIRVIVEVDPRGFRPLKREALRHELSYRWLIRALERS